MVYCQPSGNLEKAEKLIDEEKYKEAFVVLNEAVRKNPSDGKALNLLGDIYLKERNFRLAILFLKQAIEKSPAPNDKMYFDLAEALQFRHHFTEAIENYKLSDPKSKKRNLIEIRLKQCEVGNDLISKPLEVKISNLGPKINTNQSDYHPLVTADFMQIFITRNDENNGSSIFQSFNKGGWEKAISLPGPVSSDKGEKLAGISPDGQILYLIRPEKNGDIYVSDFKDGTWTKPRPFPYNSPKTESSVCVSSNGKHLFFVSDRAGSKDIYSCSASGNGWGKPMKMGKHINSSLDEESPWLDADGNYLYFSSKGHQGMGGFDVFKADLSKPGSEPENVGFPINSASDELYYMVLPDEKTAFYSSQRDGGFGKEDIYSVRMSVGKSPQLQLFKGTVSEASGLPLDATVIIMETNSNQVVARLKSHPETGTFVTMLQDSKIYSVLIEKEGYLFHSDLLNLTSSENQGLIKDIKLQKLFPGVTLVLSNIFFDHGKSSLKKESSKELQRILLILRQNPGLKAEISSHLDDSGIEEVSQKLTENRARAVVDYLVTTGIKSTRLVSKGYGSSRPVSDAKSENGREANRRTEFKIISIQ